MRKALFIGGTGTISTAITEALAAGGEWELYILNRGTRSSVVPAGVHVITADINDEAAVAEKLSGMSFDCVCDFIGFLPEHVERDWRLFKGRTRQYMYISSASAYEKPVVSPYISEGTSLANPYWQYSRDKIACEDFLMRKYREEGFPVTIIRPSHTYGDRSVPVGIHGTNGSWQVLSRMLQGKPVIIHGDGTTLWTMTHNTDFAKGFIGLMGNPHAIGTAFQITSDESLTWNQIYQCVADALGVELKPYYVSAHWIASLGYYDMTGNLLGDKACTVIFDCTKLKTAVPGFAATVRFEQGVRRTVEYVLSHPECRKPDPEFDAWCDRIIEVQEEARKKMTGC